MKNLFTLFVLFMVLGMMNAQTSEETLDWLKTKITERPYSKTNESKNELLHKIDFTLEGKTI